jgi:hypothetical protein
VNVGLITSCANCAWRAIRSGAGVKGPGSRPPPRLLDEMGDVEEYVRQCASVDTNSLVTCYMKRPTAPSGCVARERSEDEDFARVLAFRYATTKAIAIVMAPRTWAVILRGLKR